MMPFGSEGGSQVTSSSVGEPAIDRTSEFRGTDGTVWKIIANKWLAKEKKMTMQTDY